MAWKICIFAGIFATLTKCLNYHQIPSLPVLLCIVAFHQSNHLTLSNKVSTEMSMPVAANETVGIGESQNALADTQTIMIIQDDGTLTSLTEPYNTRVSHNSNGTKKKQIQWVFDIKGVIFYMSSSMTKPTCAPSEVSVQSLAVGMKKPWVRPSSVNIFKQHLLWSHEANSYQI